MSEQSASWEDLADFIQDAARQMREFGLTTLDVEHAGSRVRIKIDAPRIVGTQASVETVIIEPDAPAGTMAERVGHLVRSPMIGTFYAASSPGEPPFVQVGDQIDVGHVVGIIEAMKIMNEITSDHAGVVEEILVSNAQAVEYGQPLVRIAAAD
ncbi:MAG: acetyl-CoA carboxylase biotin carboxyl carrier protein [Thermomicrobiales bacterium]|nr:acetyl-CoA carboxylase biotin carboxyl carrier protein [Thermomicrobiales bacterium]